MIEETRASRDIPRSALENYIWAIETFYESFDVEEAIVDIMETAVRDLSISGIDANINVMEMLKPMVDCRIGLQTRRVQLIGDVADKIGN